MTIISFVSASGSPGVTTTALAVASAWPVDRLLIEADPSGGVLTTRFEAAKLDSTLSEIAVGSKRSLTKEAVWRYARELPGEVPVCLAPPSGALVESALRSGGQMFPEALRRTGIDVLIDAGRFNPDSAALPLIKGSDVILMVCESTAEHLNVAQHPLTWLLQNCVETHTIAWLLVGETQYSAAQVNYAYKIPVFGIMADDRTGANALRGIGTERSWRRSPIRRSATTLADQLSLYDYSLESATPADEDDGYAGFIPPPTHRDGGNGDGESGLVL